MSEETPLESYTRFCQITTETDIIRLQTQVKTLQTHLYDVNFELRNETEVETLEKELELAQRRYDKLAEDVVALQSLHSEEVLEYKDSNVKLFSALQSESNEKKLLQSEIRKLKQNLRALKAYLQELPSSEEFKDLKMELSLKEKAFEALNFQHQIISRKSEDLSKNNDEKSMKFSVLQNENEELKCELKECKERIRIYIERQETILKVSENKNESEALVTQNEVLKGELRRLHKILRVLQNKHKESLTKLSESAIKLSENSRNSEYEMESMKRALAQTEERLQSLLSEVEKERLKSRGLTQRLYTLETEVETYKGSTCFGNQDIESLCKVISFEFTTAFEELHSLFILSKQLESEEDPNVSQLLGLRTLSCTNELVSSSDSSFSSILLFLRSLLVSVKQLNEDIATMRRGILESTAEKLGSNMNNSCITQ